MRKLVLPALLVFLLLPVRGWSQDVREYQIKAAFIYHFAQAVEWPDTSGPFRIGVLGSDPFGESLIALENRTIHGRTVEVVQLREPVFDELSLLFVSVSQLQDIPMITHLLEGRQILTISDMPDFCAKGGMIGLKNLDNRVVYELNKTVLESAGLKSKPELARLAAEVH